MYKAHIMFLLGSIDQEDLSVGGLEGIMPLNHKTHLVLVFALINKVPFTSSKDKKQILLIAS